MEQDLYNKLLEKKNKGEKLEWDNITKEELEKLFEEVTDNMIAELYEVKKSQVQTKRNKWNIKQRNYIIKNFLEQNQINQISKNKLLNRDNIDMISIALAHYLFRNGPVENMHSEGKLSQKDMKTLNKFIVNRIAGLLKTVNDEEWFKLELLFNFYKHYGNDWDTPIADTEEIDVIYKNFFKRLT